MKARKAPRLDPRRAPQFAAELRERARAWIPAWGLADGERDFGRALLEVAARFSSEVAERLDDAGEKMRRGLLDWLAVRREAARPARVPVVFRLADSAREPVLAPAPVRMQAEVKSADGTGASVVFETETDVRLLPGRLQVVVGVDAEKDAFYLPPPGLSDLEPLEPLPTQWQLKSFAAAAATKLQLDPETGLAKEMVLETGAFQYRVTAVDGEIVTVEPPLTVALPEGTVLRKVTAFAPFDDKTRNRQEHALYLGHMELLDLTAPATIAVAGAPQLRAGVTWQYWGKVEGQEGEDWQPLEVAAEKEQPPEAVLLRKRKQGAVEPREVNGKKSRWIRAVTPHIPAGQLPFHPTRLTLRINAVGCDQAIDCEAAEDAQEPDAQVMANTTPLVLDNLFFPLGREPRQFDAFYLGSAEVFSKPGAEVQLCFDMADPTFASLSRSLGGYWPTVLAGVGRDGALHLLEFDHNERTLIKFRDREPLRPPSPAVGGQAQAGNPATLVPNPPPWRLPMWTDVGTLDFFVATAARGAVWVWHEQFADEHAGGWQPFGQVPGSTPSSTEPLDGLVYLDVASHPAQLMALREGALFRSAWSLGTAEWIPVTTNDGTSDVTLVSIAPVLINSALFSSTDAGMVGISTGGALYHVDFAGLCTPLLSGPLNLDVRPVAVTFGTHGVVLAVDTSPAPQLIARYDLDPPIVAPLDAGDEVKSVLDVVYRASQFHFLAAASADADDYLVSWPFDPNAPPKLFWTYLPAAVGDVGGGPTALNQDVVVPGPRADLFVAPLDLAQRLALTADVKGGFVAAASTPTFQLGDTVTVDVSQLGPFDGRLIVQPVTTEDGEVFYPLDQPFPPGTSGALYGFTGTAFVGDVDSLGATLKLQSTDHATIEGALLLADDTVSRVVYRVGPITTVAADRFAALTPAPAADAVGASYWSAVPINGRLAPYMQLNASNNNWDAALLEHAVLIFAGASPEKQKAKAFAVSGTHPTLVVLGEHWSAPPAPALAADFILDAAVGPWSRFLGDTAANPELSWEYWNGKGWWKLELDVDETLNLKSSGAVRFHVPEDLVAGDWAGQTNHWIRARLIGGDYGKETVTVKSVQNGNTTTQTIDRSSEGIRAPQVVRLHIAYRLCDGVLPKYVLAQDSGSVRDQSDANRTPGAAVEALVPLAYALGRLSAPATTSPTLATGRALFVGFGAKLSGEPVNVLLLVDEERPHERLAPMQIAALQADRIQPVVAQDSTRALGESGLLSMSFPVAPTPRELFGMENLTWLRLTPDGRGLANDWKPALRGAYLNAVWASAQETLTRELLGSSAGEPNLVVRVARPPVLRGSLELRVKEPLGDEDLAALRAGDPTRVLSDPEGLPGHWVLWKPVTDPGDEKSSERVYALDEASGEVRFGDGRHGMIPPIGRDSIVAFSYKRTDLEPGGAGESGEAGTQKSDDVPGNAVAARTALDLVSPVESVEAVFAADQAAGGAPPETDERVLRFGTARLRHRNRALTAADFEDLALQSSPDVVQARCFVGRGGVKLVVVMRGKDPRPNAAEARELRRLLLAAAPASLAAPDALRISGPRVRRLRIVLQLRLVSLDDAGTVSREVGKRLATLFDTAIGGSDSCGWALGRAPSPEEVARTLVDVRRLEGLGEVRLYEVLSDGAERPWAGTPRRDELVMLDEDAVRLEYEVIQVVEVVA